MRQGQLVRPAVPLPVCDQQQIGGAASGLAVRGQVENSGPRLSRQPEGDGGGAAPIQIDGPDAAPPDHLLRQILLGQAGGVAGLAAIHGVDQQSAVLLHAQGGPGLTAVLGIGPLG